MNKEQCPHERVDRSVSEPVVWGCQKCGMQFYPDTDYQHAQDQMQGAMDMLAGSMSAVLWDYSERMHSKYGLAPKEQDLEPPTCESEGYGHDYDDNGVCRNCQYSPFIGEGTG